MKIQDDKKRERIYTHHKTVLNKKELIRKLPGWNMDKFDKVLGSLIKKEVIENAGTEVKIFILPKPPEEAIDDNEAKYNSLLTEDESELFTLLSMQSIAC
ncbi:MAG: hypothetical protein P4L45_02755 [Ignavibacteriaceae bacterium]|nr:hypothetical protein [Ignavibacteriaceae bacterium]